MTRSAPPCPAPPRPAPPLPAPVQGEGDFPRNLQARRLADLRVPRPRPELGGLLDEQALAGQRVLALIVRPLPPGERGSWGGEAFGLGTSARSALPIRPRPPNRLPACLPPVGGRRLERPESREEVRAASPPPPTETPTLSGKPPPIWGSALTSLMGSEGCSSAEETTEEEGGAGPGPGPPPPPALPPAGGAVSSSTPSPAEMSSPPPPFPASVSPSPASSPLSAFRPRVVRRRTLVSSAIMRLSSRFSGTKASSAASLTAAPC